MKKCTKCKTYKNSESFRFDKKAKDNLSSWCRSCGNEYKRNFSKTKNGLLHRIYNNQRLHSRERGHPEPEYTKQELIDWAMSQDIYHQLHESWVKSGYKLDLVPSVDRLDDYKHYTFDNIRIVTFRENYMQGHIDMLNGKNNKQNKAVIKMDMDGNFIKEYHSISEACRELNINTTQISRVCLGRRKSCLGFKWKYKEGVKND